MRTIALLALLAVVGTLVLAFTFFSDESQVKRQFKKQYPSYSIDHIDEDGNESGAYYNVWYREPGNDRLELAFCRSAGSLSWHCNTSRP